jgi:phage-related protein (TIGR01555 family)
VAGITKRTIRKAASLERAALKATKPSPPVTRARAKKIVAARTTDSYQNFALNLGIGTDNALSGSTYGFNPISRNRTILEWMHRGSWIAGMTVDVVADDMTRAGIDILCDAKPKDIEETQQTITNLGVWSGIRDSAAWGRLYGGSIGVIMIDGQDYSKPLDPKKIGRGQFRGVVALDRWMVEPSLNDLVAEQGPYLGLPKFYRVTSDIPGMRNKIIHYSRCIRFEGVRLPYWQRVSENLWGVSVIERLYDRMVAFDSATQGAAQLAYKSYLRTIKVKGLREILAAGGPAEAVLIQYVDMMRRFQSIEGLTLLDGDDEFEAGQAVNMTGMSEALLQFGQQLSGATQIPLVRLFGQSPAGLNSTGESDLRTYYDGIAQQQNRTLLVPMTIIVRAAALSEGRKLPDDFKVIFRPLWQLSEEQKSEVASRDTETILKAEERGVISQQTALKEFQAVSKVTGRFTNVTDEDVESANDEIAPRGQDAIDQETDAMSDRQEALGEGSSDEGKNDPKNRTARDASSTMTSFNFQAENAEGKIERFNVREPAGNNASRYAYERAQKIAEQKGWKNLKFRDNARTKDSLPVSELHGLPIAIETIRGTIRRGEDAHGQSWSAVMPADYGYIRRAPSAEGPTEWLDCFVGLDRSNADCHVIDGYEPAGRFDEHKVMLAFASPQDALKCYHDAYGDGRRAGAITTMSVDELRDWYTNGDVTRPVAPRNLRLAANGQP